MGPGRIHSGIDTVSASVWDGSREDIFRNGYSLHGAGPGRKHSGMPSLCMGKVQGGYNQEWIQSLHGMGPGRKHSEIIQSLHGAGPGRIHSGMDKVSAWGCS